jgi:hypothetical protein
MQGMKYSLSFHLKVRRSMIKNMLMEPERRELCVRTSSTIFTFVCFKIKFWYETSDI